MVWEASAWEVAGVLLAAGLCAWILYRIYHGEAGLKRPGRWALASLRFVTLATIGLLLLNPLIRKVTEQKERPVAVVLVDDSRSMLMDGDSLAVAQAIPEWTAALKNNLEGKGYEPVVYRFSGDVVPENGDLEWQGDRTDLSAALNSIHDRYQHRNIKGAVLISDGRANRGVDPEFGVEWPAGVPLWTVGVGDTTDRPDRWIGEVACNRIAYLGNRFPLEAVVGYRGEQLEPIEVTVKAAGQIVIQETWMPRRTKDITRFSWFLDATEVGTQRYEVSCSVGADERLVQNNRSAVYVEVLERRKTVVVAARAPHPDLGWIISALQEQDAYDVKVHYEKLQQEDLQSDLQSAELIIAHDLRAESDGLAKIQASSAPVWWLAPGDASLSALSSLGIGIDFSPKGMNHRVHGKPTEGFTLFQWPDAASRAFRNEPPLVAPMGEWSLSPAWNPALQATLRDLVTEAPLMAFRSVSGDRRWAFCTGMGWWRWRMSEGLEDPTAPAMTAWVRSTVLLLTSDADVRRFRVQSPKRVATDENVQLRAELYDASLSPLLGGNIEMALTTPDGNVLNGVFVEGRAGYRLDWGRLPAGLYTWEASTILDGQSFTANGEIAVEASALEYTADRADHHLLLRLAERTGGSFLGSWEHEEASPLSIANRMHEAMGAQPLVFEEVTLEEMVGLRFLLWCLLALIAMEWIFRRRTVGY